MCCGSGGVLTGANAKDSAEGGSNKFYDIFGQDMSTGNPMGGVVNEGGNGNGNFTMSLNNLSAGTYTLTMLVGRGNGYGAGNTSSFTIDGAGISNISAGLDDYSTGSGATLNGTTVTGSTYNGDWMVMTYTFDVAADGTQLNIQSRGGSGHGQPRPAGPERPADAPQTRIMLVLHAGSGRFSTNGRSLFIYRLAWDTSGHVFLH